MAGTGTFQDAFVNELRDVYDAERQLIKALGRMAKAAKSQELQEAFTSHLEETRGQVERLGKVFESIGVRASGKHCDGMAGIIEEGKSILQEDFDDATLDASLIAAGQRSEHYEIAAYGTLIAWAEAMGHAQAAKMLQQTLDEEKAADAKLSALGEGGINQAAISSMMEASESNGQSRSTKANNGRSSKSNSKSKSSRSSSSSKKAGGGKSAMSKSDSARA